MNAPVSHHPKLITSTLFLPEDGAVLTGTVVAVCSYEGTFYLLMDVEDATGFQTWDAELVYMDREEAAEAAEAEAAEDEDEDEDEDDSEDEDY